MSKMTPNVYTAPLLFNIIRRCCAKLTTADSGASKCGNRVKKQRAGRAFLQELMQERARTSGTELMSEPRTSRRDTSSRLPGPCLGNFFERIPIRNVFPIIYVPIITSWETVLI